MKGYYFITDSRLSRGGTIRDVRAALRAGVQVIQYRDKDASTRALYDEARRLQALCKSATFLINDRVDIALAVGADGVHLGTSDMPYKIARRLLGRKRIIGLTVHNLKEALVAQRLGADYIGLSPIFSTMTKRDAGLPCGCATLCKIRKKISIPIVAIGGITYANAPQVIAAGADCLCAISAVLTSRNVGAEIKRFQALFSRR